MAISKASNSSILKGLKKYNLISAEGFLEALVYAHGAGGGTPGNNPNGSRGGNGGMVFGKCKITLGANYNIVIGGGGLAINSATANPSRPNGGGGLAGGVGYGGQGGGYTGLFLGSVSQSNSVIIAAGGGGASWDGSPISGGAGGGLIGVDGYGGGATQSAVGFKGGSGTQTASALLGGDADGGDEGGGGGGGGGYYGGGAGSGAQGGAGGGGSSYWNPSIASDAFTVTGGGATGGYAAITGTSNGNNGTMTIAYPLSYQNLTIGGGLTYSGPTIIGNNKVYFFTAGSGSFLW
jgi:hypothetical protein